MGFSLRSCLDSRHLVWGCTVRPLGVHAASDKAHVSVSEPLFEWKVLRFLQQEQVCSLSNEAVEKISAAYPTTTKTVIVDGKPLSVVSVEGEPMNKEKLEAITSEDLPVDCQVVHGMHLIAFLTPRIVS
jgi:hypothetical protein